MTSDPVGDPAGDESTITDVLEGYAQGGFSSSFDVTDSSTLKCHECGAESSPSEVSMSSLRRLEAPA